MTTTFDWDNARIVLRVPVHHTATKEIQEIEISISQLANLVLNMGDGDPLPLAITSEDPR